VVDRERLGVGLRDVEGDLAFEGLDLVPVGVDGDRRQLDRGVLGLLSPCRTTQ
jgi:hypothetical protein